MLDMLSVCTTQYGSHWTHGASEHLRDATSATKDSTGAMLLCDATYVL